MYYCEWLDGVSDIREQWSLLPLEKTIEIAEQLGIKHPHVDGNPVVMTTDFRLTLKIKEDSQDVIRTIKPREKLSDRTLELFEIERVYFTELHILDILNFILIIILLNLFIKEYSRFILSYKTL
ncbi:TnsA endonuclease N-terminal domain-containing protein [Paenibacillus xylanilyticus]|uniref:TnsA endonuclease N-terminal domain-containing protein n=1 Tax=Paenibacillus xylanilyticus TaxID=248903 RepID=UPI003AAEE3E0